MILDIGCGIHKRGDIGIDIWIIRTVDVAASAEHLPFRDDSFESAVSYECIGYDEGPDDIIQSLNEALRVSSTVEIYMWNEPRMLGELLEVPHEMQTAAYVPSWLGTTEQQEEYKEEKEVNTVCTNLKLVQALAQHIAAALDHAYRRTKMIAEEDYPEHYDDFRREQVKDYLLNDMKEIEHSYLLLKQLMDNMIITKYKNKGDTEWTECTPVLDTASMQLCLDLWVEGEPW